MKLSANLLSMIGLMACLPGMSYAETPGPVSKCQHFQECLPNKIVTPQWSLNCEIVGSECLINYASSPNSIADDIDRGISLRL